MSKNTVDREALVLVLRELYGLFVPDTWDWEEDVDAILAARADAAPTTADGRTGDQVAAIRGRATVTADAWARDGVRGTRGQRRDAAWAYCAGYVDGALAVGGDAARTEVEWGVRVDGEVIRRRDHGSKIGTEAGARRAAREDWAPGIATPVQRTVSAWWEV